VDGGGFRTIHKNAVKATAQERLFIGPRDTPAGTEVTIDCYNRNQMGFSVIEKSFDWLFSTLRCRRAESIDPRVAIHRAFEKLD